MATLEETKLKSNEKSLEINEDEFLDAEQQAANLTNLRNSPNDATAKSDTNANKHAKSLNNNHFIVPFGILIVLSTICLTLSTTICLTATAFQRAAANQTNQTKSTGKQNEIFDLTNISRTKENKNNLEKDICKEIEIFVSNLKWQNYVEISDGNVCASDKIYHTKKAETEMSKVSFESNKKRKSMQRNLKRKQINSKNFLNGQNGKRTNKSKKSARKLKRNSHKNFIAKKSEENQKKASTAEAIIYLFALVLIYLLFKAASDINQHYKSQAKGDKRLRRCSLQSYAQAHKQDRRASKDRQLDAFKLKHHMLEQRTQSLDRFTRNFQSDSHDKVEFLNKLRKRISIEEHMQLPTTSTIISQAERTNLDASPALSLSDVNACENRRCSVPTATSIALKRRTSVVGSGNVMAQLGSLGSSFDATDPLQHSEVKRRVRMINRH